MPEFLDVRTWSILQWAIVVLAAGFIGQFGKSFAQFVIAKVKTGRAGGKTAEPPLPAVQNNLKPEKQAETAGKEKMVREMHVVQAGSGYVTPPAESGRDPDRDARSARDMASGQLGTPVPDKKALKAILKRQKKVAKALKK
ncbi:MAG: hypothetical protein M0P16_01925 [Syntrophales bacterium]|jgi:hypothetical protein|nr:hypothetical protein [Syntrophales bacterium]MCK9391974.1 hypothetical protein [Syntrophales bacterium]